MKLKNGERLTKKVSKRVCLELWEDFAKTGNGKESWDGWEKYGSMLADCPLCQYYRPRGENDCHACPLSDREVEFGNYGCWGYSFLDWFHSTTKRTNKKYAKLFLEELRRL